MSFDWYSAQLTESIAIPVADLFPANTANNATAKVVGPIAAANYIRFFGKISVGVITGSANVTGYLQSCNTSNGSFVNISATNATCFTNTSNTTMTVECRVDQLPSNGTSWVQLAVLTQANSAFQQAELLAVAKNYEPGGKGGFTSANTSIVAAQTVY